MTEQEFQIKKDELSFLRNRPSLEEQKEAREIRKVKAKELGYKASTE